MSNNDGLDGLLSDFDLARGNAGGVAGHGSTGRNKGKSRRPAYRSALDEGRTDRRRVAKATGKKATVAGQYIRRTFTFRPEQLDGIKAAAKALGLSSNDLLRWFTDMGLDAVKLGTKPAIVSEVRHRYDPKG